MRTGEEMGTGSNEPLTRVQVASFGTEKSAGLRETLEAALSRHAIALDKGRAANGLVIFEQIDAELLEAVRELSRSGMDRLLAVAAPGATRVAGGMWSLLHAGASDVLAADCSADVAADIAARFSRWREIDELVRSPVVAQNLIGDSPAWITLLRQIVELAVFGKGGVLITGESGTGKELIARLIHTLDRRPDKRSLVILDCTTIVPELSGSEFFGHERGAYTGAVTIRDGAFALADGGTLFLDEVGELPAGLQPQLLRVIQEQTYKRVGSNQWQNTSFRMICATNRNLEEEVSRGGFRADLFHRIAAWRLRVPPLRDRPNDILRLAGHFLQELDRSRPAPELDETVREYLLRRNYPGNVRELRQLICRMGQRHIGDGPLTAGDIPLDEIPAGAETFDWRDQGFESAIRRALELGVPLRDIGRAASETAISLALADAGDNLQRAARRLGVTDRALQMRRAARTAAV